MNTIHQALPRPFAKLPVPTTTEHTCPCTTCSTKIPPPMVPMPTATNKVSLVSIHYNNTPTQIELIIIILLYSHKSCLLSSPWIWWVNFHVLQREHLRNLKTTNALPKDIKDLFRCLKVDISIALQWETSWTQLILTNAWVTFIETKWWRMLQENKDVCWLAWWLHLPLLHHRTCNIGQLGDPLLYATTDEHSATNISFLLHHQAPFQAIAASDTYR